MSKMICFGRNRHIAWSGLLLTALVGCQDEAERTSAGQSWLFQEALRIGSMEGRGPEVFSSISALELDELGRIYILDAHAREVRVFDSTGVFVRTMGSAGRGPGELNTPIGMTWDRNSNLWIVDPGNARYSIFDTAGHHVRDRHRRIGAYVVPWVGGFTPDGRLWESFNRYTPGAAEIVGLVGLNEELVPLDTILVGPVEEDYFEFRPGFREHVPFTPYLSLGFDVAGSYWIGDPIEYELVRISLTGDTLHRINGSYDPIRVTEAERDSAWSRLGPYREAGGQVDVSRFADHKPAFGALVVDDAGRVWVHLRTANDEAHPPEETLFDLFAPDGEYLSRVRVPMRLELFSPRPLVIGQKIYSVARDAFDVPFVVVLETATSASL